MNKCLKDNAELKLTGEEGVYAYYQCSICKTYYKVDKRDDLMEEYNIPQKENWVVELIDADNEYWSPDAEGYNTKEEAIKDGIIMAKEEGLNIFRIGRKEDVQIPHVWVDSLLENMRDTLSCEVGEFAEDYLDDVKEEHEKELEENINDLFQEWSIKYNYAPNCFQIFDWEFINVE
jgi:hypothetical protein